MVRQRVRLHFAKSGTLKFIGHNDLLRNFEGLFRRAGLTLAMSEGFHPKIKMSSPSALALGIEGYDEILELEFDENTETVNPSALLALLNRHTVKGLAFLEARIMREGEKKAQLVSSVYEMDIPAEQHQTVDKQVHDLQAMTTFPVEKPNGKIVDVRKATVDLQFSPRSGTLTAEIQTQQGPEAGVKELLTALGLSQELFKTIFPKRIRCNLQAL